jgi:hypothetical protein
VARLGLAVKLGKGPHTNLGDFLWRRKFFHLPVAIFPSPFSYGDVLLGDVLFRRRYVTGDVQELTEAELHSVAAPAPRKLCDSLQLRLRKKDFLSYFTFFSYEFAILSTKLRVQN